MLSIKPHYPADKAACWQQEQNVFGLQFGLKSSS